MTEKTRPTRINLAGQHPFSAVLSRFGFVIGAFLAFALALGSVLVTFAGTATTTASAATFTYDTAGISRVDVRAADAAEAGRRHFSGASEQSAFISVAARGTSTTPSSPSVATNTVDDLAGAACRANSFVPGTDVLMSDGTTRRIEDVKVGDQVIAFDPVTGERGVRHVTDTIVGDGVKQLVGVRVRTAEGGSTIWATEHHPFWDPAAQAWVDAGDLEVGSMLLTDDGDRVAVSAISEVVRVQRVHNLTVEGIHTYYVAIGDESVLVHNCLQGSDLDLLIKRGGKTTADFEDVATRLATNNGISREAASARLHTIKAGVENNRDVVFTRSGGVYDATSGDYLGSLTGG